eukprot:TRINITY_DN7515_c0_g1_i1.p1 TRINITY_DN7515_c0_g1~~TRINITY_DN7515_c0_g1_i1.p1  ORF type:complete len:100 (-),score=15.05 TRINITY_DN7515_c0_g1_i1:29-328(-)
MQMNFSMVPTGPPQHGKHGFRYPGACSPTCSSAFFLASSFILAIASEPPGKADDIPPNILHTERAGLHEESKKDDAAAKKRFVRKDKDKILSLVTRLSD